MIQNGISATNPKMENLAVTNNVADDHIGAKDIQGTTVEKVGDNETLVNNGEQEINAGSESPIYTPGVKNSTIIAIATCNMFHKIIENNSPYVFSESFCIYENSCEKKDARNAKHVRDVIRKALSG